MDRKTNIEKHEPNPYVASEYGKGKHLLIVLDVYTQWLQAYPVPTKEHERVTDSLLQFFGPQYHPDYDGPGGKKVPGKVYTDGAQEYTTPLRGSIGLQRPALLIASRRMLLLNEL